LHDEIIDAATDLLLDAGDVRAVSIRSVAQRVGVTPPSIYLHFADKDALLDAVCARYFEKLDHHMQQAAVGQSCTLEVLRAQGLAYVRFAIETPELYRIAMMSESRPGSNVDAAVNSAAFVHIRDSVQALMVEGVYPHGDASALAWELWTAAHGVVALLVAKPYMPIGDPEEFADRVFRAVCVGNVVVGLIGPDATPSQLLEWVAAQKGQCP
jgi:AcrR family transcriptional regulator